MNLWQLTKERLSGLLYAAYQRRLEREVSRWQTPSHIGIIADGNRRYAKMRGLMDVARGRYGHHEGADKLEEVLHWCNELGVKIVSVWGLSLDNFGNREDAEVAKICDVIEKKMRSFATIEGLEKNSIQIRPVGEIELLPPSLQEAIRMTEASTKDSDQFILNMVVAYGGREEIVEAFRRHLKAEAANGKSLARVADELDVDKITPHLYTSNLPSPDLIIRTSGEVRLGGFLLWQSAHSEYHFCDTFWPGFRRIDFLRAIRDYSRRKQRLTK